MFKRVLALALCFAVAVSATAYAVEAGFAWANEPFCELCGGFHDTAACPDNDLVLFALPEEGTPVSAFALPQCTCGQTELTWLHDLTCPCHPYNLSNEQAYTFWCRLPADQRVLAAAELLPEQMVYIDSQPAPQDVPVQPDTTPADAPTMDLTIELDITDTADVDQDFLFTISGGNVQMQVIIRGQDIRFGTAEVTVYGLPQGSYTVTQQTEWSWRYQSMDLSASQTPDEQNVVHFTNSRITDRWLDASAPAAQD